MKSHTSEFKNQLIELGRELRGVITYGETILEDEINSITPHYEADILKSVMKQLDLELTVDIPLNTIINCQIGILVNGDYEMLNYGNYVVYNSEKQEDTNTYKITCYDKLLYSMRQNEDLGIEYPISIKNYLNAVARKIGLSVASGTFYNQDLQIPSELYLGQQYTYRDILDEIAQTTGSIICLNENDEIQVKYPTITNDTIDEDYLKDINVDFGQRYGPINSIVLSRSGESDNVYLRDEDSVEQNGLTEVKIVDNQIMNFNNRSDYLQGILNALNGLYYYLNDFNSTGILYYDVGDLYNVQIGENIYKCLMLNDEINVTTGIEEIIHTDMPEKSQTDYEKADKTDMKINKTYIIVDKQNQTIESVVNNVSAQNNKISQITQTVDEINSKIQDIADITTYGESDRALVELEEINQSEPVMVKVHPTSTNISYLYPREDLYPSDLQYLPNRLIRFTRTYEENEKTLTENIDYELPDDLLRYSDTVYDEFYLNYGSKTCQVIKRCQYNADGTVSALGTERTIDYPYPQIILGEGNYTISLPSYDFGYIYARLMAKNIYTDQFYTKSETNSQINQKADEITLGVNQKLTNYSTTNQMNSAIQIKATEITNTVSNTYETKSNANTKYSQLTQKADSISSTVSNVQETVDANTNKITTNSKNISTLTQTATSLQSQITSNDKDISTINQTINEVGIEVGKKYNTSDFTNAKITAKINDGTSNVQISASKIDLTGKTINMTSDNIAIKSTNFNVDKSGNMTCKNANISGTITSNNANITGGNIHLTNNGSNDPAVLLDNVSGGQILMSPSYNDQPALAVTGSNNIQVVVGAHDGLVVISNDGRLLFQVNSQTGKIFTDNTIESTHIYYYDTVTNASNLYIASNGNFRRTTNTSSERYKTDIKDVEKEELNPKKLYDLPVRQFKYKKDYFTNEKDTRYDKELIGLIAEEVAEYYPIAIDYNEKGQIENWNEKYMVPAMLSLIQDLNERVKILEKEV